MDKFDIDDIISIMREYTISKNDGEMREQDAPAAGAPAGGGGGTTYPTVTKWESGVTRGPANQIGLTKWRDTVKINRGKANTLL
jgi:hypothetical protein